MKRRITEVIIATYLAVLALQLVTSTSLAMEHATQEGSQINSAGAIAYSQPVNGKELELLPPGTSVQVIGTQDEWLQINYDGSGATGLCSAWVKTQDIVKAGFVEPYLEQKAVGINIGYVLCESLSLRDMPAAQASIVYTLTYQATFTILEESGQWYRIQYQGAERTIEGWVLSTYVLKNPQYFVTSKETPAYAYNSSNANRVGLLDAGVRIAIIAEVEGYYVISLRGASAFVKIDDVR